MFGFAFSKIATSSTHSLCCTGFSAAGGAQSMLTVTLPPLAALGALLLLEQAAAPSPRHATAVTAASLRKPASR